MARNQPTITAIMITRGRIDLVRQSYLSFKHQTYPAKKLLIVTDGREKADVKHLARTDRDVMILHANGTGKTLGQLRNLALAYASDLSIQWDDDDWYGPTRMVHQWQALENGKSAVMLTEQLHYFRDTGQVGWTVDSTGIEGTILFDKRCPARYPAWKRGEDTALKAELQRQNLLALAPGGACYCRTYHGDNTWDRNHHVNRIRAIGKTATQLQEDWEQLEAAARWYGWRSDWRPLAGTSDQRRAAKTGTSSY